MSALSIDLKDNCPATAWDKTWPAYERVKAALGALDGKSLHELSKNFLVFPFESARSDLVGRNEKFLFSLSNRDSAEPSFRTGNVMGFFSLDDGTRMRITSRFDSGNKNFFLHYMLQKVCNVAVAPRTDSDEDDLHDFLYYLFPSYLKAACRQGVYRAYVTREYNDANVRGPIDVARHIRFNVPFNGKIAYHTREYTADNNMTQLVRHTIEFIRSLEFGKNLLDNAADEDLREDVESIEFATPSYSRNARRQVVAKNLRPVTHPYYTAYEPLRKLCLAILRQDRLSYGESDAEPIAGILFDGSALWEEYLAAVFREYGVDITHSNNRSGGDGIRLFKHGGTYYPDFYRRGSVQGEDGVVLDAKYKWLYTPDSTSSAQVETEDDDKLDETQQSSKAFHYQRGDLFQMLAYMHCLPAQSAWLVSPFGTTKDNAKDPVVDPIGREACGYGGKISIMALPIWQYGENDAYDAFSGFMADMEKALVMKLESKIPQS